MLSFSDAAENLHFFFYGVFNSFGAGGEQLSGVEAFTYKIFAFFNVFTCCRLECKLTLSIEVNFRNAERNRFFNHIGRNTRTAVQDKRHIARFCFDCGKNIESQSGPVCGIFSVNISYARGKNSNFQIRNFFAFVGVRSEEHTSELQSQR